MLNPPRVFIDDSPESIENSVFTQTWYPDVDHITWCGKWRDKEPPYWTLDDRFNNNQYVYTKDLEQKLRGDVT